MRATAIDEMYFFAQRSYSVFYHLVEASEYLSLARRGEWGGPRYSNWHNSILYGGNALQLFRGLQDSVTDYLASRLHRAIPLFSDWGATWKPRYDAISGYRNYLTHQGLPQTLLVTQPDGSVSKEPIVLKKEHVLNHTPLAWSQAVRNYRNDPTKWSGLLDVGTALLDETIDYLNDAYGHICDTLNPLLVDAAYQQLWGWDATHGPGIPFPVPHLGPASTAAGPPPLATLGPQGPQGAMGVVVPPPTAILTSPVSPTSASLGVSSPGPGSGVRIVGPLPGGDL